MLTALTAMATHDLRACVRMPLTPYTPTAARSPRTVACGLRPRPWRTASGSRTAAAAPHTACLLATQSGSSATAMHLARAAPCLLQQVRMVPVFQTHVCLVHQPKPTRPQHDGGGRERLDAVLLLPVSMHQSKTYSLPNMTYAGPAAPRVRGPRSC